MTDAEVFDALFSGGNFTRPYLIRFSHPRINAIRLVNNNEAIVFNGERFEPSSFEYIPPDITGKGASLKITGIDNALVDFVENANYQYCLDVLGVLVSTGSVQQIKNFTHFFGSVSYGNDMQLNFQLGRDDKLDMTFCPYTYDTDNNRANA